MSTPTNIEQELLELINRARSDPFGEIARLILGSSPLVGANADITSALNFFHVSVDVLRQQLTGIAPAAPLAWNSSLNDAASLHSAVMIQTDLQTHQAPGEAALGARFQASGYNNLRAGGENVFAFATNALQGHAGFFIDWGSTSTGIQTPTGHRTNILSVSFSEIGIDATPEANLATSVGPLVVTEDFGSRAGYAAQVLGVVFRDADLDNFYDAGEGLGGETVSLQGVAGSFSTTTWSSGGYQLTAPAGTYTITFSGPGLTTRSSSVTIGAQNVKVDDNDAIAPMSTNGRDVFIDTASSDHFDGGAGLDTVVYAGSATSFHASVATNSVTVTGSGTDVFLNVERLQFSNAVIALDIQEDAGNAYRLYQAAFNRAPDAAGLSFWVHALDQGTNIQSVAQGFVNSSEFRSIYGVNPTNAHIVDLFYQNVLGRAGEPAGINFWVGQLNAGTSVGAVLQGFATSSENHGIVDPVIAQGILLDHSAFLV